MEANGFSHFDSTIKEGVARVQEALRQHEEERDAAWDQICDLLKEQRLSQLDNTQKVTES